MIYCVEDDLSICDLMLYTLKSVNFNAIGFRNGDELFSSLEKEIPELIILDIMLPGEDGFTILQKLKKNSRYQNIPVIMATAKGTEYDKIACLDAGADDYLVKPFGMMEMVARIKAVLRRCNIKTSEILCANGIEINTDLRQVKVDNQVIKLTLKEYELLLALMQNINIVLSRDRIIELVWGNEYLGESRTIDAHIGTLRSKIGKPGESIKAVHGIGYVMEG